MMTIVEITLTGLDEPMYGLLGPENQCMILYERQVQTIREALTRLQTSGPEEVVLPTDDRVREALRWVLPIPPVQDVLGPQWATLTLHQAQQQLQNIELPGNSHNVLNKYLLVLARNSPAGDPISLQQAAEMVRSEAQDKISLNGYGPIGRRTMLRFFGEAD